MCSAEINERSKNKNKKNSALEELQLQSGLAYCKNG